MSKLSLILLVGMAYAQDTTVKIQGRGPQNSSSSASILYRSQLVTFALGNGTIDGTGAVALTVAINSKTGQLPAALQFDVKYTAADITGVSFALGSAASAAGKTITCAPQATTPPSQRCVIAGGMIGISDGPVAIANFQTSLTSQSVTTVTLFGVVTASIGASQLNTVVAAGGGTISMPALLASVTCAQPDIWGGLTVSCTATLNKPAPTGGASVTLSSDSLLVQASPATVLITAGATSATFNAIGM